MANSRRAFLKLPLAGAGLLALGGRAGAQFGGNKKDDEEKTRTVKGEVRDPDSDPVARAVVQLKNTRTLEVKSFFTNSRGRYYFHGLDPNVDYELKAQHEGRTSETRTVSSFDSRMELIYNLDLKEDKE